MTKKYLVVGAGITGVTIARQLVEKDETCKVDVVETKPEVGGACFDARTLGGRYYQEHGSHIFHTNKKHVWDFVSRFTDWHPYHHKVVGLIQGHLVPIPFNRNSLKMLIKEDLYKQVTKILDEIPQLEFTLQELLDNENDLIKELGEFIKESVYTGYSTKQWGEMPDDAVINRVKAFRNNFDNRYFLDTYQGIPNKGFTKLIENILEHENISVHTNKITDPVKYKDYDKVFFTGSVDDLMLGCLGNLPYRTCNFKSVACCGRHVQENSVINYPNDYDFTRTHDFSYFLPDSNNTVLTVEYPLDWLSNMHLERYYPIQKQENIELYNKYVDLIKEEYPNVVLAGRLGTYKYLNMDAAIDQAITIVADLV